MPLAVSPALTAAAEWKARHMATNGYIDHVDHAPPFDRTPAERMQACGYPAQALVGENLAEGFSSAARVVEAWLASDGHRVNLEHPQYTLTGVGVAQSATGRLYWAQDFGAPAVDVPPLPLPPGPDGGSSLPGAGTPRTPGGTDREDALTDTAGKVAVRTCRRSRRSRRTAICRLTLHAGPVTVRARLLRDHRVLARGVVHARSAGAVRLRLRSRGTLTPGRTLLRLRIGDARLRRVVQLR